MNVRIKTQRDGTGRGDGSQETEQKQRPVWTGTA